MTSSDKHTVYVSRDKKLEILFDSETSRIVLKHDLTRVECRRVRARALTTLREQLPEKEETIKKMAPGAISRVQAEKDAEVILKAIEKIETEWPESEYGPEPPTADRIPLND